MSDTPTYASLLTRLFSGGPEDREAVLAHLAACGPDRTAAEPEVRSRLRDSFPWLRLIAAEAVFRVYRDTPAAASAVASVLRGGDPAVVADAAGVTRQLDVAAVPLLVLMVRHAPDVFTTQTADFHRWAADVAVRNGPDGLAAWVEMLAPDCPDAKTALLIGMAHAAPVVAYDLRPAERPLRATLAHPHPQVKAAAGAALWRVAWRVNRDWLAELHPGRPELAFPGLRELLFDVLAEHLGRRPDVAGTLRDTLALLAEDDPDAGARAVGRLAKLGSRGWGVLVPMLHPPKAGEPHPVPTGVREDIFRRAADRPAVLPLVHHHARRVISDAAADGSADDLVPYAARVLANLGPAAGMAVPDLLDLAARCPSTGPVVAETVGKLAPGFPNAPAAVVRALGRLRTASAFSEDHRAAFEALSGVLAELDPDAAPRLVEQTGVDPRVPDLLLHQPAWRDAPGAVRLRHARVLADALGSPRPPVRVRAAELLRHYRAELPAVWPSLVSLLAGADEKAAGLVLPHFRHLGPTADAASAELVSLFREKNPAYAARAVVALWRLGRMPAVGPELRAAVEAAAGDGWGWAVLRGVVDRACLAHGLLADLNDLFAASPAAVAETVAALVNPPESPEEAAITACVPRPGDPTGPDAVDWNRLHQTVSGEGIAGALLALALMCEYGSAGSQTQKLWLIKTRRELTRHGLTESKASVERVMARLERPGASAADRQQAVHDFFAGRAALSSEIVALLGHRLGWFRWAGLELADARGLTPDETKELVEDRARDANPRVRERALRMVRG